MSNVMTYKGYSARIEYDDEGGLLFGQIAGIRDGVGFHADTVEGLRAAFHEAVNDYLEICAKLGKESQRPYSGRVGFGSVPSCTARRLSLLIWPGRALISGPRKLLPAP